jgi:hypothetical protein
MQPRINLWTLILAALLLSMLTTASYATETPASHGPLPTALSLGFTPENLVLVDKAASIQSIRAELLNAQAEVDAYWNQFVIVQGLQGRRAVLEQQLRHDPADEALQNAMAVLCTDLETGTTLLKSFQDTLRNQAIASWDQTTQSNFRIVVGNSTRKVPVQYRLLDLSEEEWSTFTRAYEHVTRSLRSGNPIAPWASSTMSDANSYPIVQAAANRLATQLEQTQLLYISAMAP